MVGIRLRVHLSDSGGRPCAVMNSLTSSGLGLRLCFPNAPAKARQGDRRKTTARSSTGFFGSCTPVLRGVTSRSVTARGRPSSPGSTDGARMAHGFASLPRYSMSWMTRDRSTTTCGVSTAQSSGQVGQPLAGGKKGNRSRRSESDSQRLGGRKQTQMQGPLDHALGRSRGGFTTKIHLVCDKHGWIVALHLTAGQAHESKAFEPTMARRLFHRRRGEGRWPNHLAGDKGYSYPRIRLWCCRRRIEAVIPTRKDQPRDERFDKSLYRQRNIIERVVGWYKEYRALGTRHEKLAVNYMALWLIAMIDRVLKHLYPNNPRPE